MNSDSGFVYLAQLFPDRDEELFKLGHSKSPGDRAVKHKCLAPHLRVIQTWRGDVALERKILKEAKKQGFLYGGEVIVCAEKDILNLIKRTIS